MIGIDDALLDMDARDLAFHEARIALADNRHDAAKDKRPRQGIACRAQILLRPCTQDGLGEEACHARLQFLFGKPELRREMLRIHVECTKYMEWDDISALSEALDECRQFA